MRLRHLFFVLKYIGVQATHSEYMRRKFDTVIKTDVLFCDDPVRDNPNSNNSHTRERARAISTDP